MTEFPCGTCECGAFYVCDATGHNVGSAMVECLVGACNDDWDLTWELIPEDDYLTGRLDDYDEVSHQIVPKRNMDGRACRGVLYFVRLHRDMAELVERLEVTRNTKNLEGQAPDTRKGAKVPELEPELDPKRVRRKTNKKEVKALVDQGDVDTLVGLCFDDKRTLRFIQRLLYAPDPAERYYIAWTLGEVCARVSTREPGPVADLLHRLFEACSDSASTSWGMVEAIGAIIANRTDIYGAFTRHLLNFMEDTATREAAVWGLSEIAATRPDLIRNTPFYSLTNTLEDENPIIRALMVRMFGRIQAKEVGFQLMALQNDAVSVTIYEQGRPLETSVAGLATEALQHIHSGEENG